MSRSQRSSRQGNSGYKRVIASARNVVKHGIESRSERKAIAPQARRIEAPVNGSETVNHNYISRRFLGNLEQLPQGEPEEFYVGTLDDISIKRMTQNRIIRSSKTDQYEADGINSLMMGYHGNGKYVCSTCNIRGNCYGHPGRIELAQSIINPAHMDKIMLIVQCLCRNCGNVFVDTQSLISLNQTTGKTVLVSIWEASVKEIRTCVHCHEHPKNVEVSKTNSSKFNQIIYSKIRTAEESKRDKEAKAKAKKERENNPMNDPEVVEVKPAKKKIFFLMQIDVLIKILNRANPAALRLFGITVDPLVMILNYLLVLPPIVRPGIEIDGRVNESALTIAYKMVIDKNNALRRAQSSGVRLTQITAYSDLSTAINYIIMGGKGGASRANNSLHPHVEEFSNIITSIPFDVLSDRMKKKIREDEVAVSKKGMVKVTSVAPSGNIPLREVKIKIVSVKARGGGGRVDPNSSINGILKTKYGEIIGRVLAKRCIGGKAVLSIGHYLEFGQIGIPRLAANEFSIPMKVTAENYNLILDLRRPLEPHYPKGRIKKIKKMGSDVMVILRSQEIEVGDEVERMVIDGDIVIFNRFPIIWRHSMSAYTVVIHDDLTIDLHQSALGQHSADFDGDTGVMRFPYSESARQSAVLMHIRRNQVSASSGASIGGLIMDASLGAYFMTTRIEEMTRDQFARYLMDVYGDEDKVNVIVEDMERRVEYINTKVIGLSIKPYTTATLYSTSLPSGFNYHNDGVIIVNGVVAYGSLNGTHLGTGQHSITRYIQASYGDTAVADYLTDSNWITVEWLNYHGLTIGSNDVLIQDEEFNQSINNLIEDNIRRYYITNIRGRDKKENPHDTERKAWSVLESTQGLIADLFINFCEKNTVINNSLYHLIKSGKISKEIVGQMIGSVGVVTYFNQFCPESEGRCTIYGLKRDERDIRNPGELGFIQSSYSRGVTPLEAFIGFRAAMGGAVSTNCATADFGHIYNLLNAVLTSCYVTKGMVVQYMGSIPKIIMMHSDVRGIDTEKVLSNSRKEFGLGNLQNIADSVNLRTG